VSDDGETRQPRRDERESLLNPAFLAILLAYAAKGHEKAHERPMPISLAFVIPPLALHGPTREVLPSRSSQRFGGWLEKHPVLRAGFARRARTVRPAVQAGLRMGLRADVLTLEDGKLNGTPPRRRRLVRLSEESEDILKQARFLGAWLGAAGSPTGLYDLLGVRP
jgi:Family of unknown function (DUF6521)